MQKKRTLIPLIAASLITSVLAYYAKEKHLQISQAAITLAMCVVVVTAVCILSRIAVYIVKRSYYLGLTLAQIDKLDGHAFEIWLENGFKGQGYTVENVGHGGKDFGGDLIIKKKGSWTIVQAKRYTPSNKVGVKAIQEAIAAKEYYHCDKAMVITTSYFSAPAKKMAEQCKVTIMDRDYIKNHCK